MSAASHGPVGTVQGVAGPGIAIVGRVLRARHHVVGIVVDAFEAVHWPVVIALGRVVVDDIEDDFDAGLMQGAHHLGKVGLLATDSRGCRIPVMGREEVQRHVAPLAAFTRVLLEDRHQLDGGDAKFEQVGNLLNDASERASRRFGDTRVRIPRKSSDVQLVDDRVGLVPDAAVASPIERVLALTEKGKGCPAGVVPGQHGCRPIERRRKEHGGGVRIQQELLWIEPMTVHSLVCRGTMDAVGVIARATGDNLGNAAMPDAAGFVLEIVESIGEDRSFGIIRIEQQRHGLRMPGVERKVVGTIDLDPRDSKGTRRPFSGDPARH